MKNRRRAIFPVILAVIIYIVGITVGVGVMCQLSLNKQKDGFNTDLSELSAVAKEGIDSDYSVVANTGRVIVYNAEGEEIYNEASETGNMFTRDISCQKYMSKILSGKKVITYTFRREENANSRFGVYYIAGIPVFRDGKIIGAIFSVKYQMYFANTLTNFIIYFTIFYWIAAIVILIYLSKLRQLQNTRNNYIANVTHTLKTPAASIKALAETLVDGVEPDPVERMHYCEMILDEVQDQTEMVDNILALSKIQSSSSKPRKSKIAASDFFEKLNEKYSVQCAHKGLNWNFKNSLNEDAMMYTNESALWQILSVMLDNSVKFTSSGGNITLEIKEYNKKRYLIRISDTGVGIDEKTMPHIYERFYSGNSAAFGGSGLGLAIAESLAKALRERLWITSEPGLGTDNYVTVRKVGR